MALMDEPMAMKAMRDYAADAPAGESLRDCAARLLSKLEGLQQHVMRIDRGPIVAEKLGVVQTEKPGLSALLDQCHAVATELDNHLDRLAGRIGPI